MLQEDQEEEGLRNTVGCDLSLTGTGVVVIDPVGDILHKEKFEYNLKRSARLKDKVERWLSIAKGIIRIVEQYTTGGPNSMYPRVGIEGYSYNAKGSAVVDLGELGGVVRSQLWLRFAIEPAIIAPSSGRKAVFGNGRLKKKLVIPELRKQGFDFDDGDIADAYVVARTVRQRSAPKRKG